MKGNKSVAVCLGGRNNGEGNGFGIFNSFGASSGNVKFIGDIGSVGIFLNGDDLGGLEHAFNGAVFAEGVTVFIVGKLGKIAETVEVMKSLEVNGEGVVSVLDGELCGVIYRVVGHGEIGAVHFYHGELD